MSAKKQSRKLQFVLPSISIISLIVFVIIGVYISNTFLSARQLDYDWRQRESSVTELSRLLSEALIPVNEVFQNRQINSQKQLFQDALSATQEQVQNVQNHIQALSEKNQGEVQPDLKELIKNLTLAQKLGDSVFINLANKRLAQAGESMAQTDAAFVQAMRALTSLRSKLSERRELAMTKEVEKGEKLLKLGLIIAALTLLTFLVLVIHGLRLQNRLRLAEEIAELKEKEISAVYHAFDDTFIVARTDAQGKIIYANQKFCEISKYSSAELLGQDHRILNSGVHSKEFFKNMWKTIQQGQVFHAQICNRARDGSLYWVDTTILPQKNSFGKIESYVAFRFDITAEKALETKTRDQKKFYESILNNMLEGYVIQDQTGAITEFNDAATSILGLSADQLLGRTSTDPRWRSVREDGEDFPGEEHPAMLTLKTGQAQRDVLMGVHKPELGLAWIQINSVPLIPQGGVRPSHAITTFKDVTAEKKLRDSLLEEKNRAEHALKVKSEFLSNMSHEIRTPLNGVLGAVNLLVESELTDEQRDLLNTISISTSGLLTILNDILDIGKLEAGQVGIEKIAVNLRQIVADIQRLASLQCQTKGILFELRVAEAVPTYIETDSVRIKQILMNLLSNAIKFTTQGKVSLNVNYEPLSKGVGSLRFSVTDTGIGIRPEAQAKLFKAFSQGDSSTTRKFGGTGLGLIISAKLAELMDGRITFTSQEGQGSTFIFEVKVKELEGEGRQRSLLADKAVADIKTMSILVAEDNPVNQKIILMMLERLGYKAQLVENGMQAFEAVKNKSFDIVFMDMQMPEMDGISATTEIRQYFAGLNETGPFIVALTANAFEEDRQKCMKAGMNAFLSKPIIMDDLKEMLKLSPYKKEQES